MKKITILLLATLMMPIASAQASTKSINTKSNKLACKNIKVNYKSDVMSKWSNNLASDSDVLQEIQFNINMISKKQKSTTGKIKSITSAWINIEKDTKNALTDKNIEMLTNLMTLKINVIKQFDNVCKSIEK
jgi:hypothetical protein